MRRRPRSSGGSCSTRRSAVEYDAVGGLTLGADPVAAAMLHASTTTGAPVDSFVVRKEGKAHGLQRRIEGPDVAGRRVLAVEDTSTTGGSVLTAVEALREAGAEVVAVAVIVDRGARAHVEARGLTLLRRVRTRGSRTRLARANREVATWSDTPRHAAILPLGVTWGWWRRGGRRRPGGCRCGTAPSRSSA